MRILQIASEYPPQAVFGLGRYVADLSRALAAIGHDVHVLTNSVGGPDADVVDRGVHVHRVDFPPPPKPPAPGAPLLAFNLHLQQLAHAVGLDRLGTPEIVVSHDWLTALAGHRIARRWDLPHVWTVHDTVLGKRFGVLDGIEDEIACSIEAWASRSATLVLANSTAIADEVASQYGTDRARLRVLSPGIDPARFAWAISERRADAFRSVLAAPGELLVTYCGRLDLEKGLDTLLNAFAALWKSYPNARLAIAGRGVLEPVIHNHASQLGIEDRIRLLGYLEGKVLDQFYRSSDLHVCPSHYEPFGLVAVEAMAAGAPVVVSATGGLRDIVPTPEVGRAIPPRDVEALANALRELANDTALRKRIGEAGRRHVLERFAWPVLAREAEALYQGVLCTEGVVA